jgi:putative cardiolipin synthase
MTAKVRTEVFGDFVAGFGGTNHVINRLAALCLAAIMAGCATLPALDGRPTSNTFPNTDDTPLGRAIAPRVAQHPGRTGIHPLIDSHDAFAARALLAGAAERSLDVQYYIWQNDLSGTLLFAALCDAADRGVRVRLLLDDNNTSGLDPTLAALDAHPNIEVRLFNPFAQRSHRWAGYLTDFSRLNRRMHNKSFTADNQATIIGGRNIGDEYFAAAEGLAFVDLDVLAVGPVVQDVSADFDRYWASGSSHPVGRVLPPADPATLSNLVSAASLIEREPAAAAYVTALRESAFIRELIEGELTLEWALARMISDDPAKGLGQAVEDALLMPKLRSAIGDPVSKVELISAYFVPEAEGTDAFAAMQARGVSVRILTNSLEATDVAVVHAGYAKRRKALLEAGVTLYELRRLSPPVSRQTRLTGSSGSSASSLHAKTFAVDDARLFIGSFNFDPRSANLNTEIGFVIESPALAKNIAAAFDARIPAIAYQPRLTENGALYWIERKAGEEVRHDKEPGTRAWQRGAVRLLSLLPIDWLL